MLKPNILMAILYCHCVIRFAKVSSLKNTYSNLPRAVSQNMAKNSRVSYLVHRSSPASNGFSKVSAMMAKALFTLVLLLATLWVGLIFWVHLEDHLILRAGVLILLAVLGMITLKVSLSQDKHWQKWLLGYGSLWLIIAVWYVWLPPKQDRPWMAEVSQVLQFSRSQSNPNLITLHNVRNFDWARAGGAEELIQPTQPYYYKAVEKSGQDVVVKERWSERTIDLNMLDGVDIINSYWMGEQIGHTLLSFRFKDERPLTFSIEIRKEQEETFSAFGGFVKQFEMAIVASEERDIVYTRSNVRGEQVYIFPIEGLSQQQIQHLFLAYLQQVEQLQKAPKWYNTLLRNCTTVIFDMVRAIDPDDFPWDYRILMSGYVPNYLYDQGVLPDQINGRPLNWGIEQWYTNAHINPKVADFSFEDNQHPSAFSRQIRQGLPQPGETP